MGDEIDPRAAVPLGKHPSLAGNLPRLSEISTPVVTSETRPTASLLKNRAPASFEAMRGRIALQKRFARKLNRLLNSEL